MLKNLFSIILTTLFIAGAVLVIAVMVGMMPANGLFAGVVAERFGVSAAFVVGAAIWAACVLVAFGASKRLRRLRT